jgi:putative ABC transport system permease protein
MKFMQAFKMAFSAIIANKMRSFLTMLGIIIGVFSVTVLITVGQGTKDYVASSIQGLGSNMLIVNITAKKPYELTLGDLNSLKGTDGIADVSPLISSNSTAKAGTTTYDTSVEGAAPGYDTIRSLSVASGRFITSSDLDRRGAVAVIGTEVADNLFGTRDVIGNTVSVLGRDFTIVGVLTEKGSSMGMSNDNRIIIPFTTAQRLMQRTKISQFFVSTTSADTVDSAQSELEKFIQHRFPASDDPADDYRVFNQSDILGVLNTITGTLTAVLGGIAGISLLVGGIGIMNIMLVSVSERTREIGIRKAIGAQRSDILLQFLIEAVAISITGGIIGLYFGYIGALVMGHFFNMSLTITPGIAALGISFSVAVGVIFGSYPANRAAKLRPIEALRYE